MAGRCVWRRLCAACAPLLSVRLQALNIPVDALRRQKPYYVVIIDNMMNLDIMLWGADSGLGKKEWKRMAISHALNSARDHIRPDGSTYHVVVGGAA